MRLRRLPAGFTAIGGEPGYLCIGKAADENDEKNDKVITAVHIIPAEIIINQTVNG